jgi:iron complex outermembrane recepter protein
MFLKIKSAIPICLGFALLANLKLRALEMPEIIVRAESNLSPTAHSVVEKAKEELSREAGAYSVIDLDLLEQKSNTTLADSLLGVPGLYARARNQTSQSRISIRGSGAALNADTRGIALQLDGLPLNTADADFDYLSAVEPLALSHIRVSRTSNTLGSFGNNLGGSINFISHTGETADPAFARAEFGSFAYWRQHAAAAWQDQAFDGFVSINNFSQDGFREHSQTNRQHLTLNLGWKDDSTVENRLSYIRVHSDEELPGALSAAEISADSTQAVGGAGLFNRARNDWRDEIIYNRVSNQSTWQDPDQSLHAGFWFSFAEIKNPRNQIFDKQYHDAGARWSYRHESIIHEQENHFSATLTTSYAWSDETTYLNRGAGQRGTSVDDVTLQWFNTDLFLQNRWPLSESLSWITSLQLAYAQRAIHDRISLPGESLTHDEVDYYVASPSLGLLYQWDVKNQIYLNLSRSHEPPTQRDLYRSGAQQYDHQEVQTASTFEIGARGEYSSCRWDAALYHSRIENEFLITETAPGISETRNTPESIHQGIETSLHWEFLAQNTESPSPTDSLLLSLVYHWNHFRLNDDPLYHDNPIPGIPEHLLNITLSYQAQTGFFSSLATEIQPEGLGVDYANTLESDAFSVFDWRIGYKQKQGFEIFFEIRNLFDEHYINEVSVISRATASQRAFFPAPSRSFYGGIAWKW